METKSSLQQKSFNLQQKIRQLEMDIQLDTDREVRKNRDNDEIENNHINDSTQTEDKNNTSSMMEYSPIHANESLHSEGWSVDMQGRSPVDFVSEPYWEKTQLFDKYLQSDAKISLIPKLQKQQPNNNHLKVQFQLTTPHTFQPHIEQTSQQEQNSLQQQFPITPSLHQKKVSIEQSAMKLKKSTQLPVSNKQSPLLKVRNFYNSAIKQKSHCEECISRMHQLHEMEFLKNKYHREYIALRAEVDKMRLQGNNNNNINNQIANNNQYSENFTPRSSLNLVEFYGEPYLNNCNQEKSQKSSFSFENIQNTLLSERFALQMEECIKLSDRLLLLDRKCIELSQGDYRLLVEFQTKMERLKYHLGLDTEPKFLVDLFSQLEKSQLTVKNIHEKYRKLIQKLCKSYNLRVKRSKQDFNKVNEVMILTLKDLSHMKVRNERLQSEIEGLKGQLGEMKDLRSTNLGHQVMVGSLIDIKDSKGSKDSICLNDSNNTKDKQRDPHVTIIANSDTINQLDKSSISSYFDAKTQKQMDKLQVKIKTLERQIKAFEKMNKEIKSQLLGMKKKALSDFNQFINVLICNKEEKRRNVGVGTMEGDTQDQSRGSRSMTASIVDIQTQEGQQSLIQTLGSIIYEIFSFTSLQTDENPGIFQPQTQQQLIEMLQHIKNFASKFDLYQKQKQRQITEFKKNFLQLLKFFIQHYKIAESQLLEQINKSAYNNQPLVSYIKNYYSKSIEIIKEEKSQSEREIQRDSSEYTFGQKSESCKDSEVQP